MTVDLDQVEVRQTIDQAGRDNLADPAKIIGVDIVDVAAGELFGAGRDFVEHLIGAIEVMNRAKNEIEAVPVFLHPGASGSRGFGIVVQLEARADFDVGIRGAQFDDLVEIDSGVITVVIGEREIGQAALARAVDPRLEQRLSERLDAVTLWMRVVIREWSNGMLE
jgi:hypothetical protein